MRTLLAAALALTIALPAGAETIQLSPHVYSVNEGVTFSISNNGTSSFLLSWSDSGGTFSNIPDPSLVVSINETYTFVRTTSAHPFVITDETLPTNGTDGSYSRTTTDGAVIDAATLTPIADFTADPAPTTDQIVWTPSVSQIGNYFYTCRVTTHTGMTGGIRVVSQGVGAAVTSFSTIKALYRD